MEEGSLSGVFQALASEAHRKVVEKCQSVLLTGIFCWAGNFEADLSF
jgi:hypothetical protein